MITGVNDFAIGGLTGKFAARIERVSIGLSLYVGGGRFAWSGALGVDELPGEPTGVWWVARCLVKEEYRGRGLGSFLVAQVQEHFRELEGFRKMVVEPGGYNADPARQRAFYERQGFREEEPDGALIWTG